MPSRSPGAPTTLKIEPSTLNRVKSSRPVGGSLRLASAAMKADGPKAACDFKFPQTRSPRKVSPQNAVHRIHGGEQGVDRLETCVGREQA